MQHRNKNMKKLNYLIALSLMMAFTSVVHAGKTGGSTGGTTGGTTTSGGFTFQYNVGTVLNYHAYGVAGQIGSITQPRGTLKLGQWYVWDLGAVAGVGTVTCPQPVTPKGQLPSCLGLLVFANKADVGGQAFLHPSVDVEIFTPKWYNGYASIGVVAPDGTGTTLYWGLPFSPFAWDISAYLW